MSDIKMSVCGSCGFQWPTGQHGGHSCSSYLRTENASLKARIVELEGVIKSRPKHCYHIGEDGEFYNIEDYINKVSSWAFSARKALRDK